MIDAYYGGPNLFTSWVKAVYQTADNFGATNLPKISSIGPVGGKLEFLLSQRIGLGVNVNYANTSVSGSYVSNGTTYDYKASIPRLRIMPTLSIHMGKSDKLDPYFAFGVGYGSFAFKEKNSDPNYTGVSFSSPSNFAARAEFGLRYFITDHIGINGQFGIGGGPLVAGGLSFKF